MSEDKGGNGRTNRRATRYPAKFEPPDWLSTEELEHELFQAVAADSNRPAAQAMFERIDAYFALGEPETEVNYRQSLLWLLADFRPRLAELLGGPRKFE